MSTGGAGFGSPGELGLHQVPRSRLDDRLVVTAHVVLGHLAFIGLGGFGEKVGGEGFL